MTTTTRTLTYKGVTKAITIHVCESEEEYAKAYADGGVDHATWYSFIGPRWIRGFWDGKQIVLAPGAIYDKPHEIGHAFGLQHTPWLQLTTMNPSHILRWFDTEGLKDVIET